MARSRQGFTCNTCGCGLGPDDTRNKCRACKAPAVRGARKQIHAEWRANAEEVVIEVSTAPKTFEVRKEPA